MPREYSSDEYSDDDKDEDYMQRDTTIKSRKRKSKKSRRSSVGGNSYGKPVTYKDLRLGFSLFQIQKRKEITESVSEDVKKEQHWFMKAASKAWKALSPSERAHYNDISAQEISKIHNEKARRKKAGKQKKVSGYQMFLAEQMKLGRDKRVDHQQWVKSIGATWRNMSEEERATYNEEAAKRNEEYEKQYKTLLESINTLEQDDENEDGLVVEARYSGDIVETSDEEENNDRIQEDNTPKKNRRKRTRIDPSTFLKNSTKPRSITSSQPLHAKSVIYMNRLIQARLNGIIDSEQYEKIKPFVVSKTDAEELILLLELISDALNSGEQVWVEKKGSEYLNNVVQLLSMD
jgi:hypothetical protein